jgi:hypothetical protein
MPVLRRCVLTLALPAAMFAASDIPTFAPTPARAPKASGRTTMLVDRVIPGYGMDLPRRLNMNLSAADLALRARDLAATVEAGVMAGTLHRASPSYGVATDKRGNAINGASAQIMPRQVLPEETELLALFDQTVTLLDQLQPRGLSAPIPEHQLLDEALSSLTRAAELLRLGLGDDTYTDLDARTILWQQRFRQVRSATREQTINELMATTPKLSRRDAEAKVDAMDLEVTDIEIGEVTDAMRSAVTAKDPTPVEAPKPAPAPKAMPKAAPAPEPVAEPAAPAPADDLPPLVEEPAPAPAEPDIEFTPAPAEPEPEAAPAPAEPEPEAAPAPAEPEPEAAPAEPEPEAAPAPAEPEPEAAAEPEPMPAVEEPAAAAEPEPEAAPAPAEPEPAAAPEPKPAPAIDLDDLPDL